MAKFGKVSKARLAECDPRLQKIFNRVIEIVDCSVLCGHRGEKKQEEFFKAGKSQKHYPDSKHNKTPSLAIDVVPYPVDWTDIVRFKNLAKIVKDTANYFGIEIEWGGDWEHLKDYPHYQLKE